MTSKLRFEVLGTTAQAVALVYGAVFPYSIAPARVPRVLAHADLLVAGKRLAGADVKTALIELYGAGLLRPADGTASAKGPVAVRSWAPWLSIEAHRQGKLDALVGAFDVEHPAPLRSYNPASDEMLVRWVTVTGRFKQLGAMYHIPPPCWRFLVEPDAHHLMASLPERYREAALRCNLEFVVNSAAPADALLDAWASHAVDLAPYAGEIAFIRVLQGRDAEARALFRDTANLPAAESERQRQLMVHEASTQALISTLAGADVEAQAAIQRALSALKAGTRKRKVFPDSRAFTLALLALVRLDTPEATLELQNLLKVAEERELQSELVRVVREALNVRGRGTEGSARRALAGATEPSFAALLNGLWACWRDNYSMYADSDLGSALVEYTERAARSGYVWLAQEGARVVARIAPYAALPDLTDLDLPAAQTRSLADLVQPPQEWEVPLKALEQLVFESKVKPVKTPAPAQARRRQLVWQAHIDEFGEVDITPREQTATRTGSWSKGKPVTAKRLLAAGDEFDFISEQDRVAALTAQRDANGWRRDALMYGAHTLFALAGHPRLFNAAGEALSVVEVEPALVLEEIDAAGSLRAHIRPYLQQPGEHQARVVTAQRYEVTRFEPSHRRLFDVIPPDGLELPAAARDRLLQVITSLASDIRVESTLGAGLNAHESVEPDPQPWVRLEPWQTGLAVALVIEAVAGSGIYQTPGTGITTVFANVDGQIVQTERDLASERAAVDALLARCSGLPEELASGDTVAVDEPLACLELLEDLRAVDARLLWPEGEKYKVVAHAETSALRVQIKSAQDWFSASAELEIDNARVLDLERLFALLDESPRSRFLQLEDGAYVALSNSLHRQLQELRGVATPGPKGTMKVHAAAALTLDALAQQTQFEADAAWHQLQQRWAEAQAIEPELPSTLQAELRPYQLQGFQWLARLSHWGAGACLADDMGLGKTVQTLALLLQRATQGPSLVVAPTSVVPNWLNEARRFAPTLRVVAYGGPAPARYPQLDQLAPYDLVVTTYGLLQSDAQRFADIEWGSVVLDEAQAIKNAATKRARAVRTLSAGFRVVTTGTPVQNNLMDLHSLFSFTNPGLLGSAAQFRQRFALPIERDGDSAVRTQLQRLIAPFVLRRLKSEVLDDLPPRTDITLHVDMSSDEAALYEALRRRALDDMETAAANATAANPGERHLQVLAHLTRLRLACCNPQLVQEIGAPASSKLATFGETLSELLEGGHKVLVFSQFVRHLRLIEEHVVSMGVSYQYLDGQTPQKQRAQRIDAFQGGDGDVFLISLKAGGTGLNLTAADYVIHMDPWWNPAVEDQASDRAHRIGQTRPVTVYRLVTRGTIEEQIVELHARKRDLADQLLEGSDATARLDAEGLLELLQEPEALA